MRLILRIDGIHHEIDTTNPDLLFAWVREIFGRMQDWYPSTQVTLSAFPSFLYKPDGTWAADWSSDSRFLGQVQVIRSPGEWVDALTALAFAIVPAQPDGSQEGNEKEGTA
jgi:hypothetical protein